MFSCFQKYFWRCAVRVWGNEPQVAEDVMLPVSSVPETNAGRNEALGSLCQLV